jgi:hypothetical protein
MLTIAQVQYIDACIASHINHNPLSLYYCISHAERCRLLDQMHYEPVGTILEARTSITAEMANVDRRIFWKKTPYGIYQVATNTDVNAVQSVVFNP